MKTHRVKPKNSLGTISGRVFFPGWNKLWYIVGVGGGGKKSKRFFPGEWFTEQIFIGELSGVDSAGVLRQGVRVTTSNSEWYNDLQQMSENKWQRVVQRETTSGTTRDNEWYNERQQVTTNDSESQWVAILANFPVFLNRRGTYCYAP